MRTVYAILLKSQEIIGDFETIDDLQKCLDRMTKLEYAKVDHIFARELKDK